MRGVKAQTKLGLQPFDIGDSWNKIANGNESMIFRIYKDTSNVGIITRLSSPLQKKKAPVKKMQVTQDTHFPAYTGR